MAHDYRASLPWRDPAGSRTAARGSGAGHGWGPWGGWRLGPGGGGTTGPNGHTKVHVDGDCLTAWIDGVEVMSVAPTLVPASQGHIGLFVDIGTEAYFSNVRMAQA